MGTSSMIGGDRVDGTMAEEEHIGHLDEYARVLRVKAVDIAKYQEYEITKEGEFKDVIEHTNAIIQWCAIIQTLIFCILGMWQIWSLRKFFIKRGMA